MTNWFYAGRAVYPCSDSRTPAQITEDIRLAAWAELAKARAIKATGKPADYYSVNVSGALGYMRRYVSRVAA